MQVNINCNGKIVSVDLDKPFDISIPLRAGEENVNSFYIPPVKLEPFRMGTFVGSVKEGGGCNVNNILFNPHGNGTHTECVGHISKEDFTINQCLKKFFFFAKLITVDPEKSSGDLIITKKQLEDAVGSEIPEAIIIRTLPNNNE